MALQRKAPAAATTTPAARTTPQIKPQPSSDDFDETENQTVAAGGPDEAGQASAFDSAPSGFPTIPPGKYEALIVEAELLDFDPAKGRKAKFAYEIADEGDQKGKKTTQYYSLLNADGTAHKGAPIFKKDMGILGFPDIKFADIPEALEMLVKDQVGVSLTAKINGQYTNVNLNGVVENSEILDDYRENRVQS